jgi:hypothetical protein
MYYVTRLIDVYEALCYLVITITDSAARLVEALRYKSEGRGFD